MFGEIIMNTPQIIEGHYNEFTGKNEELSKSRMKICRQCHLFTDILGGVCDAKKCWDTINNELVLYPGEGVVCGCSCRLKSKTTLPKAKCVLGKW